MPIMKFYGVTCDGCKKHICLGNYPAQTKDELVDARLPQDAIRCPYCDFRSVYVQARLEHWLEPCDPCDPLP